MFRKKTILLFLLLLLVTLVYSNHFGNGFHFDDSHAVVLNPYIRDIHNIPRFFTNARTISILPTNRTYRPLVSTSLAIDYWAGGGLNPLYFQASTFCWFLVQLVLMFALFRSVYDFARPDPRNMWVALFATAWYGLHPAMAETVNYVVQRGDLYSTLGVVAGVLVYARYPRLRMYGLYLFPFVAAVLSKAPALIFPTILFMYIWLFDEDTQHNRLWRAFVRSVPAFFTGVALAYFSAAMTPKEFNPGVPSAYAYRITQPLVALRYFQTFFAPGGLTADTDHAPLPSIWTDWGWLGFVFVLVMIAGAFVAARWREWRPVAFGIWWFLLALVPTSLFPLGEVENDHRMFFPFVGLVLSTSWPVALWIYHRDHLSRVFTIGLASVCACELAVLSLGTLHRNQVWRTEESLWHDVSLKSPRNGRGLNNYGVALAEKGDYLNALQYFEKAKTYARHYALIETNLGVVKGKLNRDREAEQHFRLALQMNPNDPTGHRSYARWLAERGRSIEAIEQLRLAIQASPDFLVPTYMLLELQAKANEWTAVRDLAESTRRRFPADPGARSYRLMAAYETGEIANADPIVKSLETANDFLSLSALYYDAGEFEKSIGAAQKAVQLKPNYPEAYNNIAAAQRAQGNWDAAAQAAREALRLRPNFDLARKNLARSQAQQKDPPSP
jgi:protein O-mannosyl-transferase